MSKFRISDIIAILSCTGIILLIISDYCGGMSIWLLSYFMLVLPVVIIYIVSFFNTLISLIVSGYKKNKAKAMSHFAVLITIAISCIYNSNLFKPNEILSATLHDDLFHYKLALRENGICDVRASGFMGYDETFTGKYEKRGDTIIFVKLPYDNDNFIPSTLLLDRTQNALLMERDKDGRFVKEKKYLNHFVINKINQQQ